MNKAFKFQSYFLNIFLILLLLFLIISYRLVVDRFSLLIF